MQELPDNPTLLLVVAWALGPGIWLAVVAYKFGHLKGIHLRRFSQCAMVCVLLAGAGHSQNTAWSQQQRENESRFRELEARQNSLKSDLEVHSSIEKITRERMDRDMSRLEESTEEAEKDIQSLKGTEQRLYGISLTLGALGSGFVFGFMEVVRAYRNKNGRNGNGGH